MATTSIVTEVQYDERLFEHTGALSAITTLEAAELEHEAQIGADGVVTHRQPSAMETLAAWCEHDQARALRVTRLMAAGRSLAFAVRVVKLSDEEDRQRAERERLARKAKATADLLECFN